MPPRQPKQAVEKPKYSTPAVEKALDVIEILASEGEGLTRTQIARQLGRSLNEVFRIISTLEERGYLATLPASEQPGGRQGERYSLTLKLFDLSTKVPKIQHLIAAAHPIMAGLTRVTGQSCHLSVIREDTILVVATADAPTEMNWTARLGARFAIENTSSGKVAAAFCSTEDREVAIAAVTDERGRTFKKTVFLREIEAIEERGYDVRPSDTVEGVYDISFPIVGPSGYCVAALTVPFVRRNDLKGTNTVDHVRERVRSAAETLSVAIGAKPEQFPWKRTKP